LSLGCARGRNAGLPTGGKKRKIFERLKQLKDGGDKDDVGVKGLGVGLGDQVIGEDGIPDDPSDVDERFEAVFTDPGHSILPRTLRP